MALCTVTPGLRQGACQAALQFLGWPEVSAADARDRLIKAMWVDEDGSGLHPLARSLLARWLARAPATWRDAHEGYVTHYTRHPQDAPLLPHHNLALVESTAMRRQLTAVVSYLESAYVTCPAQDWLRVLDTVTGAPNRLRTTRLPSAFVTANVGEEERGNRPRIITRLTVARWLYNDRCFDPGHQLAKLVADEYDHLRNLDRHDGEVFFAESVRYRRIEREWEN